MVRVLFDFLKINHSQMKTIIPSLFLFLSLFAASTLQAQTLDRSIRPAAQPAKEIQIKDAQTFTLKNGLKVFLVEDKTTPIVYYSLMFDTWPALQGDKAGLHDIFNDVYGKATTTRTKEQLNREVDLIAARLSASRNNVYISYLKKYEGKALDIFADVILHPVFNQEDYDLTIQNLKTYLASIGDDGSDMNTRVSNVLTYGKNYPNGELETLETIENVALPDLTAYYDSYFAPNVARLVIVGDVSLKEAKASAEKYLGGWKKKSVPVFKPKVPEAPAATQVAYVVKPEAVQSFVSVTYPVPFLVGQAGYDEARVMANILGGSSTGYLFLNLREKHSYTYGAYVSLDGGEITGRFQTTGGRGATSVKAIATDSAVYEIFHELNRILTEPVEEKTLAAAKTYMAGSFSRSLESSGTLASFAVNIDKYKLPKDYYKNYLKRIEAITVADVQAAARRYVCPDRAWIVVTGDKVHAEKLLPFASDGTIHYYDYNANSVAAPVSESVDLLPETLIENYLQALGGQEAIDKIVDYTVRADVKAMGQTLSMTQNFKAPNKTRVEMQMGGRSVMKMNFDGATLRMGGMGGTQEETEGAMFDNIRDEAGVAPEANYVKNGYLLSVGAIEEVGGRKVYVLTAAKGESKQVGYYDVETGLKVKTATTIPTPVGDPQTVVEYSDYRPVEGVQFPFRMKQSMGGMDLEVVVTSVEVNKGVDDAVFQ
jgi:predicted Zn-dependent peptidase